MKKEWYHYANHLIVNDHGSEIMVKTFLLPDGSMVQQATSGLTRSRPIPTEAKPFPEYGFWHDPLLEAKK